jgi:hypothetical protein
MPDGRVGLDGWSQDGRWEYLPVGEPEVDACQQSTEKGPHPVNPQILEMVGILEVQGVHLCTS